MPPLLVPLSTGPRLQVGDLLLVGKDTRRQCRVVSLRQGGTKATCVVTDYPNARPFDCTSSYALLHRVRGPKLPHTVELHAAIRKVVCNAEACIVIAASLVPAAAREGHLDAVDRLGQTALHLAASAAHPMPDVVESLLLHGASADTVDFLGLECPLHRAARLGCTASVLALLQAHASPNALSHGGVSALMRASAEAHYDVVAELLRHGGANVHLRETVTNDRLDALRLATLGALHSASSRHLECAKLLATYGALDPAALGHCPNHLTRLSVETHTKLTFFSPALRTPTARPSAALLALGAAPGGLAFFRPRRAESNPPLEQWLGLALSCRSPLHHAISLGDAGRITELLRDGADLHGTRLCGHVDAEVSSEVSSEVSPLAFAAELATDATASEAHVEAARLVLAAASSWSPATARLFPQAARQRAAAMGLLGHQLAQQYGEACSWALWELWVELIMPQCIVRSPASAASAPSAPDEVCRCSEDATSGTPAAGGTGSAEGDRVEPLLRMEPPSSWDDDEDDILLDGPVPPTVR